MQLLSTSESQAIDCADMSIHGKFLTRITIHAWRVLLHIATTTNSTVENLNPSQIIAWIEADIQIRQQGGSSFLPWESDRPDSNPGFDDPIQDQVSQAKLSSDQKFLTRMIVSAQNSLCQIGNAAGVQIADLTSDRLIEWIKQQQVTGTQTEDQLDQGIFLRS